MNTYSSINQSLYIFWDTLYLSCFAKLCWPTTDVGSEFITCYNLWLRLLAPVRTVHSFSLRSALIFGSSILEFRIWQHRWITLLEFTALADAKLFQPIVLLWRFSSQYDWTGNSISSLGENEKNSPGSVQKSGRIWLFFQSRWWHLCSHAKSTSISW